MKVAEILGSRIITEGMIKLPSELMSKVEQEFYSTCLSYLQARLSQMGQQFLKSDDITTGALNLGLKVFKSWAAKRYPRAVLRAFDVKQGYVMRTIGNVKTDDLTPEYQKLLSKKLKTLRGETDIDVGAHLDGLKPMRFLMAIVPVGGLKGYAGQYSDVPNTVEVNLDRLKSFGHDDYFEFAQSELDGDAEESKKARPSMLTMLNHMGDRMDLAFGTVKHEVTHYMQFAIFGKLHPKQIHGVGKHTANADESTEKEQKYFTSQVEFDPQLKSAISQVEVRVKAARRKKRFADVDWKPFAKVAIGELTPEQAYDELGVPDYLQVDSELLFFHHLKEADKAKWKKAVKLFMTELDKQLS